MTYTYGSQQANTIDNLAVGIVDSALNLGYQDMPEIHDELLEFHGSSDYALPNEVEMLREAVNDVWIERAQGY